MKDEDRNWSEAAHLACDALEDWEKVIRFLEEAEGVDGARFPRTDPIPGTTISLSDLDKRCRAILQLITAVVAPEPSEPVPVSQVAELKASVETIKNAISTCKAWITAINKAGGVQNLTPSNWIVTATQDGNQRNFASQLQSVARELETAAIHYWRLAPALDDTALPFYGNAIDALSGHAEETREASRLAKQYADQAKSDAEVAASECRQVQADGSEIAKILDDAKDHRQTISELATECLTDSNQIEEILKKANEFDPKIDAANKRLKSLDIDISERTENLDEMIATSQELEQALTKLRDDTSTLADEARDMLHLSTEAGLAGSFSIAVKNLDKKVHWAKIGFYVSIAFLAASSIPLVSYLFSDFGDLVGIQVKDPDEQVRIAKAISMVIIMLPFIWLARFSGNQYDQLFSLREHYQHKYSLAMSVAGFKSQAPQFADIIATETYYQLTVNPAEKLIDVKRNGRHPNPVIDWFMERVAGDRKKASEKPADTGQQ